jgi:hypothetical protein
VIEEPGSSVPIVVRDVELRNHKVIRSFDRTRRGPGTETSGRENLSEEVPVSWVVPHVAIPAAMEDRMTPESQAGTSPAGDSHPGQVWENWQPPVVRNRLSRPAPEPREEAEETPAAAAATFAGGLLALEVLRTCSSNDADSPMMRFSRRVLSPAARLRRRLRK